jgi:hypothetical protein
MPSPYGYPGYSYPGAYGQPAGAYPPQGGQSYGGPKYPQQAGYGQQGYGLYSEEGSANAGALPAPTLPLAAPAAAALISLWVGLRTPSARWLAF